MTPEMSMYNNAQLMCQWLYFRSASYTVPQLFRSAVTLGFITLLNFETRFFPGATYGTDISQKT
jgi:hypothetical protein